MPETSPVARKPRRRFARGQARPRYLEPGDNDRLMIMLVALMSELSALRDRVDTHEALAEQGTVATSAAIEAYELTAARGEVRERERLAMLHRVLRVVTEERDAAAIDGPAKPPRVADVVGSDATSAPSFAGENG